MDLNKLDLFFAAANSNSFTQAAEKCNVAQTTVSKYIAQLEEELGMKLFYRTTRECFLTEAGHTFYNGAKELVKDYDDIRKQLQQVNENELRIGIYGEFFDLSILGNFRKTYPDVELKVSFDTRTNLYDQLNRRKIHVIKQDRSDHCCTKYNFYRYTIRRFIYRESRNS
jgi:DNA-binding transcriptional LysR family regulator